MVIILCVALLTSFPAFLGINGVNFHISHSDEKEEEEYEKEEVDENGENIMVSGEKVSGPWNKSGPPPPAAPVGK